MTKSGRARPRVALLVVLAAAALALPAAPAAAAPTCDGKTATIVGTPRMSSLRGTERADVIVSNGAGQVHGMGGSDRICVTRGTDSVRAGYGHDRVFVKNAVPQTVFAYLEQGNDLYIGGSGRDFVEAGTAATRDRIATGPGADDVTVGQSRTPTADIVRLGRHSDVMRVLGLAAKGHVFDGNDGRDWLEQRHLDKGALADRRLTVDNSDQVARAGGEVVLRWDSFQNFAVWTHPAGVYFSGSHRPEGIYSYDVVGAAMGGGDDVMKIGVQPVPGRLRGGAGRDVIIAGGYSWQSITGNVEAGRIDAEAREGRADAVRAGPEVTFADVEDLTLTGETVRVLGDDGPNRLDGFGCNVEIVGYGGNDMLSSTWEEDVTNGCTTETVSMFGGDGDDRMTGWFGNDKLYGGPGNDVADGRRGSDLCRAEQETSCELE